MEEKLSIIQHLQYVYTYIFFHMLTEFNRFIIILNFYTSHICDAKM